MQEVERTFLGLCSKGRDYLTLPQVLKLSERSRASLPLDLSHVGVLWLLDGNRDGRVTLAELHALADLCRARSRRYQSFEFEAQMRGYCSLQLWRAMCAADGQSAFTSWCGGAVGAGWRGFDVGQAPQQIYSPPRQTTTPCQPLPGSPACRVCALVLEGGGGGEGKRFRRRSGGGGGSEYVGVEAVASLHQLFRLQQTQGLAFQDFLNLLQRAGEEGGALDLDDPQQDDWVALETVRCWAGSVFAGVAKLLTDIYPAHELGSAEL